jgi:hypothetical protein
MNALNRIMGKSDSPVDSNWQMQSGERAMLSHVLRETQCVVYAEIGIWFGGSLIEASSIAKYAIGIDIDNQVLERFSVPENCEIRIGASHDLIPDLLNPEDEKKRPSVLLIDGDHAYEGVFADLKSVAEHVSSDLIVILHDTGHREVRNACKAAFKEFENIYAMDLDLVPARVIMEGGGKGEVWGGLGIFGISAKPAVNRRLEANFDESLSRMNFTKKTKKKYFNFS